jgi:hypothetical protein
MKETKSAFAVVLSGSLPFPTSATSDTAETATMGGGGDGPLNDSKVAWYSPLLLFHGYEYISAFLASSSVLSSSALNKNKEKLIYTK